MWLCGLSPERLAGWALELLLQQACQAVVFVRDLDRSALGAHMWGLRNTNKTRNALRFLCSLVSCNRKI